MKNGKRTAICVVLAICAIVSMLSGCGSTAASGVSDMSHNAAYSGGAVAEQGIFGLAKSSSYDAAYDSYEYEEDFAEEAAIVDRTSSNMGNSSQYEAKIIYSANIDMETTEYEKTIADMDQLVASVGAYYEQKSERGSGYRSIDLYVRVPNTKFREFVQSAGDIGNVLYKNEYAEDVSESYYDTDSRLSTAKTKLARLQALLAKADNMEDIISLEEAISDTEYEIDNYSGTLRYYDSRVNYSSVNISIREVSQLSDQEETPIGFGERLSASFRNGIKRAIAGLETFMVFLVGSWIDLIVIGVIVIIVVSIVRKSKKKKIDVPVKTEKLEYSIPRESKNGPEEKQKKDN